MQVDLEHPTAGRLTLVGSPLQIPTAPPQIRYPPPLLGQHTEEILAEFLNLNPAEIAALRQQGVV
jgi:crotonobetainyl-CoA:carnitine CoA-transferase CaiB-like acyl-CoA transferase